MRRCATSERTMTPAKTSTGLVQVIPCLAGKHDHRARVVSATLTSCDDASATPCRWRVQKYKLDNKSQLKGRMTIRPHENCYRAFGIRWPLMMIFNRSPVLTIDFGVRPVRAAIASKSMNLANSTSSRSSAWDHPGRLLFGGTHDLLPSTRRRCAGYLFHTSVISGQRRS
jgi:hypothetical protein